MISDIVTFFRSKIVVVHFLNLMVLICKVFICHRLAKCISGLKFNDRETDQNIKLGSYIDGIMYVMLTIFGCCSDNIYLPDIVYDTGFSGIFSADPKGGTFLRSLACQT